LRNLELLINVMNAQVWIAILVGLAAVIDDLRRRQIANWIPVAALAGGLGWQVASFGWTGWLYGLGGAAAGFAVFLIFYLLGGMGGGDVKLMTGFGALLGAGRLAEAALWTAGVGGLLALAVLACRALRARLPGAPAAVTPEQKLRQESIPYAPAIALGVWLSLVPKG
jgi:prepilin peptidase CpaA